MQRKQRNDWLDQDTPFLPSLTVYETTPEPVDTGLLNADGTKLYRRPETGRLGFDLRSGKA